MRLAPTPTIQVTKRFRMKTTLETADPDAPTPSNADERGPIRRIFMELSAISSMLRRGHALVTVSLSDEHCVEQVTALLKRCDAERHPGSDRRMAA
jgi:hypothetical protein